MLVFTPAEKKSYNNLFNAFHDFENDFFGNTPLASCKTDIIEEKDRFVIECELPGFDKQDIKLDIEGDNLTITAEHSAQHEEKRKDGSYIRRERSFGSYRRSFNVDGVDIERIDAEYNNGVLELSLPKKAPQVPSTRRLEIK